MTRELLIRASRPLHMTRAYQSLASTHVFFAF